MNYKKWLSSKNVSNIDKARINEMTKAEKEDAFNKLIDFGTAGLRGIMDVGTNRMNEYTVAQISQALSDFMNHKKQKKIVIACDVRNNSKLFLDTAVNIFLLNNLEVYIFNSVVPVPILSYSIRKLKCDFGIYITASHNTKEYNGYKILDNTGCQINEKIVEAVNKYREKIDVLNKYEKSDNKPIVVVNYLKDEFIKNIKNYKIHNNTDINITYTGLFGTGSGYVDYALNYYGFNVHCVESQREQNGDFPGLPTPNPEDDRTFKEALVIAKENNSDIIIASDPDADRLGLMVKHEDEYVKLSGNQVGILLANYICKYKKYNKKSYIIFSDVSTNMVKDICKKHKVETIIVPTGFKYIGNKMNKSKLDFLFAFEESCGYLIGPYGRDKDSIGASVLIAEMAAFYKDKNMTLVDELEKLYKKYGYHKEKTYSIPMLNSFPLLNIINWVGESVIGFNNLTLKNNVLFLDFKDKTSLIFRMSGTEPKMKVYIKVVGETDEEAKKLLDYYSNIVILIKEKIGGEELSENK